MNGWMGGGGRALSIRHNPEVSWRILLDPHDDTQNLDKRVQHNALTKGSSEKVGICRLTDLTPTWLRLGGFPVALKRKTGPRLVISERLSRCMIRRVFA